jgi:hypothetical protein
MHEDFPPGLRQFIENHLESVPQLESLLLLRQDAQRAWSAADVGKALYIPEDMASSLLNDFVRRGFAATVPPEGRFAYRIRDKETDALIATLMSVYQERRVAVISLIYSKPLNKVQTFADAFRFGKESPS